MKPGLKKLGTQFVRYGMNAGVVLAVKLAGVALLTRVMHPSIAYAVIHVVTVVVSYTLHTRLSFETKRSWRGFFQFLKAVIGAKVLDYLIFNVAFVYLDIHALSSVVVATVAIFFVRFFMIRKALTPEAQETPAAQPAEAAPGAGLGAPQQEPTAPAHRG